MWRCVWRLCGFEETYVVCDGDVQHVLVEGACKVSIEQLVVCQGLANDAAHEAKVVQVVRVDVGQGIGLAGRAIRRRGKQGVVRVEDCTHKNPVCNCQRTHTNTKQW